MKRIALCLAASASCIAAAAQAHGGTDEGKILVAYFSATGNTAYVAELIAAETGGDLYRITPVDTYTAADLDWRNRSSRSSVEMADPSSRPAIMTDLKDADSYDTIYLGFPIWWDVAPHAVNTFLDHYGFEGKTVIPFATSGGSSIANSERELRRTYPEIKWQTGRLLNSASRQKIDEWIE